MSLLRIKNIFSAVSGAELHERLKLLLLSLSFFLIIGGYTVVRTLKDSLFIHIVGKEYIPQAKLWSILILIPAVLLFSKLTDILRRHHLIYFYAMLYGIGGLIIAYFIGHPTIGLANPETSKFRLFGWFIYFFIEGYQPFVVSLFWSFCHTLTTPDAAKVQYPLMVAASKFGGILTAGGACIFLRCADCGPATAIAADVFNHQLLLVISSLLLLLVPLVIGYLVRKIPNRYLHGYEAAYQVEVKREKSQDGDSGAAQGIFAFLQDIFSGLIRLVRYPYMLGIFGVIFFWEVINVFVNFERLGAAQHAALTMSGRTAYLLYQDSLVHAVGIVITLVGTRVLIDLLGERKALLIVPLATGSLLLYYLTVKSAFAMVVVFVLIRSINYAFASPLRESLYIPTTKDMKFKTKSWIDSFGTKIAKGIGSGYNSFIESLNSNMIFTSNALFFGCIIGLWILVANMLGRRYESAVRKNEVIGAPE